MAQELEISQDVDFSAKTETATVTLRKLFTLKLSCKSRRKKKKAYHGVVGQALNMGPNDLHPILLISLYNPDS